jgi:hypothetical protein
MWAVLPRRSLCLVGFLSLLSTGLAVSTAFAQSSGFRWQIAQAAIDCADIPDRLDSEALNETLDAFYLCDEADELSDIVAYSLGILESGTDNQKLVILHGLMLLSERLPTTDGDIRQLISLLQTVNPKQLSDLPSVQAIAATTNRVFALRAIDILAAEPTEAAFASRSQDDLDELRQTLLVSVVQDQLLSLYEEETTPTAVKISALTALRDIGYALPSTDESAEANDRAYRETAATVASRLKASLNSRSSILDSSTSSVSVEESEKLLIELRAIEVQALASFLLIGESTATSAEQEQIRFLNKIAADPAEATEVRSAAIASLERLGSMNPAVFGELNEIVVDLEEDNPVRISAVETMSRIEARSIFLAQSLQVSQPYADTDIDNENSLTELEREIRLLQLLSNGLNSSDSGKDAEELRQRAAIAFEHVYSRDLAQLSQAISYASGSGTGTVQYTAVQALGAVDYRHIARTSESQAPWYLRKITRFLSESLMCSPSADIRKGAAFALGQIAPEWPELLEQPLGSDPWYNLIPEQAPNHWNDSLKTLCSSQPEFPQRQSVDEYRTQHKQMAVVKWLQPTVCASLCRCRASIQNPSKIFWPWTRRNLLQLHIRSVHRFPSDCYSRNATGLNVYPARAFRAGNIIECHRNHVRYRRSQ